MSLETHIAGSEDRLLDSLHFAGRNSASYITARRAATFAPSSAASWPAKGLIRFNLADHAGWLDGGTLRLIFTLTNNHVSSTLNLHSNSSAATMIRRCRIIANGSSTIEDVENYGRVLNVFTSPAPTASLHEFPRSLGGIEQITRAFLAYQVLRIQFPRILLDKFVFNYFLLYFRRASSCLWQCCL